MQGFAFLIHAGADKARLQPIVRALIAEGVRLWIDEPHHEAIGLTSIEIARLESYSIPGRDWAQWRNEAMRKATCFLVAVSDEALGGGRPQVEFEITIAEFREEEEKTPFFPLMLSQRELEQGAALIGRRQGFKTFVEPASEPYALTSRGEIEIARLIETLKQSGSRPSATRGRNRQDLERLLYLADRSEQALDIADALRQQRDLADTRLAMPLLMGTRSDRPDKFISVQLPQRVLPRVVRHDECRAVMLEMPPRMLTDPDRAARQLTAEILDVAPLPRAAVLYAQPAVDALMAPGGLEKCLTVWADAWAAALPVLGNRVILPVFDVRSDFLPSRPLDLLLRRRAATERLIAATCMAVNRRHASLDLFPLMPLGRLRWDCVEHWLRDELDHVLADGDLARLRAGLMRGFRASGMAMEQWAELARPHLRAIGEGATAGSAR